MSENGRHQSRRGPPRRHGPLRQTTLPSQTQSMMRELDSKPEKDTKLSPSTASRYHLSYDLLREAISAAAQGSALVVAALGVVCAAPGQVAAGLPSDVIDALRTGARYVILPVQGNHQWSLLLYDFFESTAVVFDPTDASRPGGINRQHLRANFDYLLRSSDIPRSKQSNWSWLCGEGPTTFERCASGWNVAEGIRVYIQEGFLDWRKSAAYTALDAYRNLDDEWATQLFELAMLDRWSGNDLNRPPEDEEGITPDMEELLQPTLTPRGDNEGGYDIDDANKYTWYMLKMVARYDPLVPKRAEAKVGALMLCAKKAGVLPIGRLLKPCDLYRLLAEHHMDIRLAQTHLSIFTTAQA